MTMFYYWFLFVLLVLNIFCLKDVELPAVGWNILAIGWILGLIWADLCHYIGEYNYDEDDELGKKE